MVPLDSTKKHQSRSSTPQFSDIGSKRNAKEMGCLRIIEGKRQNLMDAVPLEEPVAVILNGERSIEVAMTPTDVEDFVIGHLICEGQIDGPENVKEFIQGEGWVEVRYEPLGGRPLLKEVIFSACFGQSKGEGGRITRVESDLRLSPGQLQDAASAITNSETHRKTGGVHTCGIFRIAGTDEVELISLREDIGRHNALDKAVGGAARKGFDFSTCFAVTTGRASSEMVAKCHEAGIPILCSRGATTTLAIETSRLAGITLVGFARRNRISIYCNPERIK